MGLNEQDRRELADELIERIRIEGIPDGAWLVEIAEVRQALQAADGLLRRLQDAIIRSAQPRRPPGP